MRSIVALAVLTLTAATALAGPGDGREDVRYRDLIKKLDLRCPRGTRLLLSDASGGGFEESCVNADGERHGYFIRWFADGETWATVGRYDRGKPAGRWMNFNAAGQRLPEEPFRSLRRPRGAE